MSVSRRLLLGSSAAASASLLLARGPARAQDAAPAGARSLSVGTRMLEIKGRAARVFSITDGAGRPGLVLDPGERFRVALANRTEEPTILHWHGQTPPVAQDGMPGISHPPLPPGGAHAYDFAARAGTHWMHSHHALQEMNLMAAPLIVHSAADRGTDRQEVMVLLHDFSFTPPEQVLAALRSGAYAGHGAPAAAAPAPQAPAQPQPRAADPHAGHRMGGGMGMGGGMPGMMMGGGAAPGMMMGGMDLNDHEFDAYLANDRTLDDPEVVRVAAGGRVLLRLINGAAATVFWIDLGALEGRLVAVDGNAVQPVAGRRFPFAMGQRLDIALELPRAGGTFPILAQREGDRVRTGIILATRGAAVRRVAEQAGQAAGAMTLELESRLRAASGTGLAPREPDRRLRAMLTGSMSPYEWGIDGRAWGAHRPLAVRAGERVELTLENHSMMAHPMHLHGHHFQVVAIGGRRIAGALRDTVHLPPMSAATLAFTADNPGRWFLHCHNLLHMATGMMTEIAYAA